MLLYLVNTLERLRTDDVTFFRIAHVWCFGTDPDLSVDVIAYRQAHIVPKYVQRYLDHIKEQATEERG